MRKSLIIFILELFCIGLFAKGKQDVAPVIADVEADTIFDEAVEVTPEEAKEKKPLYSLRTPEGEAVKIRESWGYVMQNRESEYNTSLPITDVCYFAAEVNSYGELVGVPNRNRIKTGGARCHLVVVCDSRSLSHFVINPNYDVRKDLLNQIVKAASNYDGVQLDFEYIPVRDSKAYITFIADLRYKLKGKMLSVCVPARFRRLTDDAYPYADIALYCDRVVVMAYDEHWSTSAPGAIASVDWCKKILDYASKDIPEKKLIMGLPFYGRTWAKEKTAGAWYFSGVSRILLENEISDITYENDIPKFSYETKVNITGYFNDAYSVVKLARLYESAGVKNLGFWRIGQEDPEVWNWINIRK